MPAKLQAAESKEDSADDLAVKKPARAAPAEREPSLIVKLKFKKGVRERLRQILRMRPTPDKTTPTTKAEANAKGSGKTDARHRERIDPGAKGVAQKVRPSKPANGLPKSANENKRLRSDDSESDERPTKRQKEPDKSSNERRQQQPSTPNKADVLSPSSAQKSATTSGNMRKDLLSVSMKRDKSIDSNMGTPSGFSQASPPDAAAPNSQGANGTSKPSPSSQPSTKTPRQAAWEEEQKRLEGIGRELKHAATAHEKSLSVPKSEALGPTIEQKLAAISALESLLAYLLAFTCSDEAAHAADPKVPPPQKVWQSLQYFYSFVKEHCQAFPILLGIASWLRVVMTAHLLEIATQSRNDNMSRDHLMQTQASMLRAATEAEAKLDLETLQEVFPKTWKGRAKGTLAEDKPDPAKGLAGKYKLPIGIQTSPLTAARAGHAMLTEWIGQQDGLKYEMKLKL
jgi:hypothetical protein